MGKYRRPAHSIIEEPTFFLKHWWHDAVTFLTENKDQLLTAVVAILVILAAAMLWQRHRQSVETDAWSMFLAASSLSDTENAVLQYAGTSAGPFLRIKLADSYMTAGEAEKAVRSYSEVAEGAEGIPALRARFSLATALEGAGRFEDALNTLRDMAAQGGFWGEEAQKLIEGREERKAGYEKLTVLREAAAAKKKADEAKAAEAEAAKPESPVAQEPRDDPIDSAVEAQDDQQTQ